MDVTALHAEAKTRYWQDKDLPAARRLLEEGIALARSQERPDLEKPLLFDLASFCWPGWDEPGIAITTSDILAGERAAKENLRLTKVLQRGDAAMGNAWWIVGVYRLAQGRHRSAVLAFQHQSGLFHRARDKEGVLLAAGYLALASQESGARTMLESVLERLRRSEGPHGAEFADGLATAARVFGP